MDNSFDDLEIPVHNLESVEPSVIENELQQIKNLKGLKIDKHHKAVLISAKKYPEEVLQEAITKLKKIGLQVPTVSQSYPILQMSCASCASNAEALLNNQVGVYKAEVNYANAKAQIEYLPSLVSPETLKAAVISGGYDMLTEDADKAKEKAAEEKSKYYIALQNKVKGAWVFALPLLVIGMFFMDWEYANWAMFFLATPLVFYYGQSFYIGAWQQARHKRANMDTLVAISTGLAYLYSIAVTLYPGFFHAKGTHPHSYFEAAGIVIAFVLLGKMLEEKAKNQTSGAIKKLMGLQPATVTLIDADGSFKEIEVNAVQAGQILLVRPGESIAVDGTIVNGSSLIDESMITGEALLADKKEGDTVLAGTINQNKAIQYLSQKVGKETVLAQIIQLVEQAQGSKAPVQKLVDKIAGIFVPVVIAIAVLSAILWLVLGGENAGMQAFIAFITVLVIACPCALGLATPTAIMVAMGKAADNGILIKDAESLEMAKNIDVVVLDKTGTITKGAPQVNNLEWFEAETGTDADILYTMEIQSDHPLSKAIVTHLKDKARFINGLIVENIPGKGLHGTYGESSFLVGNLSLMQTNGLIITDKVDQWNKKQLEDGQTTVFVSKADSIIAGIAISDAIKETSAKAIQQLQNSGIEVLMLTGDNAGNAKVVAQKVGITNIKAGVLPMDKAAVIKALQADKKTVAMIGDGINDSAALAQADVSIAMGKGSAIAMDVAKMTIISSDLLKIPTAIRLSGQTSRTIKENLFWAFIYNVIGIPVAAGLLYPFYGFTLHPMWAGAAMAFSSVSVVSNSLRLKWKKIS